MQDNVSNEESRERDPADRYKRRELYKLIIANDSIHSARDAMNRIIAHHPETIDPFFEILHDRLVVSYGRPFTEMDPFRILSTKWTRFKDAEMQKCHDMLIESRNRGVAHAGYMANKVIIFPPGTLQYRQEDGSTTLNKDVHHTVKHSYFSPIAYGPISKTLDDLAGRLNVAIQKQMKDLFGNLGPTDPEIELMSTGDIEAFAQKNI